ncbi:MAG: 6-phosphogluconolactonase [Burkholderiales bacterium]|nr:6-phosphogluconolactonase [Burkholderiales bacterium]
MTRWHQFESEESMNAEVGKRILAIEENAIAERGIFRIVLAGGSTPRALYLRLAQGNSNWDRWQVYFGDERCLPRDHPYRNSKMALDSWLSRVSIPESNLHIIPAELGPVEGAAAYSKLLENVPEFDLVLLGLGEDGHTASLFPGNVHDGEDAIAVLNAPKAPASRISLGASRLAKTRNLFFLVAGESKRNAVSDWRSGKPIPAAKVDPSCGADVFIQSNLMS